MESNMKRQFSEFLNDISFEIQLIKSITKNISLKEFKSNLEKIRAVTKSLEIIGEAVSNIPTTLKEKYPKIEWRKIKGFRDVVTHQYWSLDINYEQNIITIKLDILEKQIKEIIKKENL